ncbi:hypothetical protein IRJ16_08420 [Mucilaginibacter myungsuensis]|uniref:Uncharacterized protein n=2 Tax=Mucilaginibacter myungsuensis TaxID=649104 RepID=A0A929PVL8_9SPHI|nr:hypothetical protein [Mucilaginibacter myungsuensis]
MNKRAAILAKVGLNALLIAATGMVYGQKLPSTQEASVWAPVGVKVDGKLTEWNPDPLSKLDGFGKAEGKLEDVNSYFKALNKTVNVYYTMSNDENNLYLVVKSAIDQNNMKIMAGGITLAINTNGKKNEKDAYSVTFPIVNRGAGRGQRPQGAGGGQRGGGGQGGGGGQRQAPDSAQIAEMRKQQIANIKDLRVLGFKEITDTLVSIYNEYGIKAAANFDEKGLLFYELSIPLKLMGIAPGAKEFAYNIKANGLTFGPQGGPGGPPGGGGGFGGNRGGGGGFGGGRGGGGGGGGFNMQDMMSATDFWGKYTLAKKQ